MSRYIDADLLLAQCRRNPLFEKTEEDKRMIYIERSIIDATPTADVVEIPEGKIGNLSDGYHTFNELYHHRAILFSVICNSMPDKAWKSKLHDTGDMFEGMFIVGIETPEGQATYHYDIEPYWDMFKVNELEKAPKWDGHTPQIAIERISKLSANVAPIADTVRKMQEMVKRRASTVGNSYANGETVIIQYCISPQSLDQIAKEMLEVAQRPEALNDQSSRLSDPEGDRLERRKK